jgi:hypothetical protein
MTRMSLRGLCVVKMAETISLLQGMQRIELEQGQLCMRGQSFVVSRMTWCSLLSKVWERLWFWSSMEAAAEAEEWYEIGG